MADKSEDETCDQTGETTEQENEVEESKQREEPLQPVCEDVHAESNSSSTNENTKKAKKVLAAIGVGVAACVVGVLAAPVVAGAALGAAGFTASGVAAGSAAAAIQSAVYGGSVAASSLFALAQSAGATGAIGVAATAAIGGGTGVVGAAATYGALSLHENSSDTIKLMICGSGKGAHAFAGIASSLKGADVRVLSLYQDEAERWSAAMQKKGLEVILHQKGRDPTRIVSKPALVTKNAKDAIQDIHVVVFVLPALEYRDYLEALKPHIKAGTIIVGLPGYPGFEYQARDLLGDTGRQCTIMNFELLPWMCSINEFGVKCEVHHTKETLVGTMKKGDLPPKKDPVATLQYLLGPLPKLLVSDSSSAVQ